MDQGSWYCARANPHGYLMFSGDEMAISNPFESACWAVLRHALPRPKQALPKAEL
jgi:hypothetical protein